MTQSQPPITRTTHTLPFDKLSPRDFERLCLWLVEREGYERGEHLGAAGSEQGRDIVAWRQGALWAFQCKRVRSFGPRHALAEVEKVLALPATERPAGLVFLVTCDVSTKTRQQACERCAGEMECHFWAGTELDEKVKRHPNIVEEFFQAGRGSTTIVGDDSSAQVIKAEDGSTVSSIVQSQIGGDVINSIVVTAGGDVIINYADGRHESFDGSAVRRQYLEAIVNHERFNRWADERYIDETTRPLPMNVAPRDLQQSEQRAGPKRDLIEVVEENLPRGKPVLILGEPGAGKTTALERLTYLYACQELDDTAIPLPVLIPLNRYDGSLIHIFRAVLTEVGELELSEKQTDTLMSNVKVLILFDGLNELGRQREDGVRAIRNFMAAHPCHRYVVTCRTQDYRNDLEVKEAWEVQPLDERDVERYLKAHLGDEGRELYAQIRKDERLMGLARNPLLLRMIRDAGVGGRVPQNRGELCRSFVKKILWREGQKGDRAHGIPGQVKERALAQLGYRMQQDSVLHYQERQIKDCFVGHLQDWSEPYNWRELLAEIELNGLLRPMGDGWTFMHQSLQEFFAAHALEEANLPADVLDNVIGNPEWNGVIFLLSGITRQGSKLVKRLLSSDPFIAAKSISQGASPDHEVLRLVIDRIGDISKDESWGIRRTCADLMGEIRSSLAHPHLMRLLQDSNSEVRWGAVYALKMIGVREGAAQALLLLLDDPFWVTQGETAIALGELGAVEAIPQLGKLLDSDSAYVRVSATYALVKLFLTPSTPGADELSRSPSERVRTLANFAIQVVAHRDRTTFIRESLRNDSSLIREAAVMLLVRARQFDAAPEVAALLEDSVFSVRAAAVGALGRLQAREFVPEIIRLMLSDSDAPVRETAVNALEWMHANDAFPYFLRAAKDESPGVRLLVVRTLGRLRITEGRPVLRELAQTDPDSGVRLHAVRALGFLANPDDMEFLERLSGKEVDSKVIQSIYEAAENVSKGERKLGF